MRPEQMKSLAGEIIEAINTLFANYKAEQKRVAEEYKALLKELEPLTFQIVNYKHTDYQILEIQENMDFKPMALLQAEDGEVTYVTLEELFNG